LDGRGKKLVHKVYMFAASSNNKNAVKTTMCLDGMDSAHISHRIVFCAFEKGNNGKDNNAGTVTLLLIILVCAGVIVWLLKKVRF
jgi:hypothetical protein